MTARGQRNAYIGCGVSVKCQDSAHVDYSSIPSGQGGKGTIVRSNWLNGGQEMCDEIEIESIVMR